MLNVFFTVDVEVWCKGWLHIDKKFPDAFRKYIYGPTPRGCFGLPYQLDVLKDHGLKGVFFVEPLFSARFGAPALAEIVGLIQDAGQEIQLHLHPEWTDEALKPILKDMQGKRQHLRYYSLEEQTILIAEGLKLLGNAGVRDINAFRAGSFGFNADTLSALAANGITFDSSYNASLFGPDSGVLPGVTVVEPIECRGVYEYPMTVFNDGTRSLRHAQLTACSFSEMEGLLWQALDAGRSSFVILSHNFELLNKAKNRPDDVVVQRFQQLCAFLSKNRNSFCVRGFHDLKPQVTQRQPAPLTSPFWRTGTRMIAQAYRERPSFA
ncbi:MAG: polysaccharide deacetylase [Pseudomonadota bacterium]